MKRKLLFLSLCFMLCGLLAPTLQASAEELEEKTAHITDPQFEGIVEEMMSNIVAARATAYTINWSIAKRTRCTTGFFSKAKDSYISIGFELSQYGSAGIIDSNGNMRYVEGTSLYHTFDISVPRNYCVFVYNPTSVRMTATGYYVR